MTASYVTVICDLVDGSGQQVTEGAISWAPSQQFPSPGDDMLVTGDALTREFRPATVPQLRVLANDTAGPQQDDTPGWTWNVTAPGVPGFTGFSVYVLSTNGDTQRLSALASVPAAQPGGVYLLVQGTPATDDVPVYQDDGSVAWEAGGGGGGGSGTVTSVAVESANGFAGTVADSTTTPQFTLKTTVNGVLKGNSTTGVVSAAAAGTDYLAPSGNGSQLTGLTQSQISGLVAALALLAPLASPALTGAPTAPTQSAADGSTKLATTAYADGAAAAAQSAAEAASDAAGAASTAQSAAETYADTNKLAKSADLSDVASASTARTNLGLGTAATHASTDFDAAGAASTAQSNAETYAAGLQPTTGSPLGSTVGGTGLSESTTAALLAALLAAGGGTLGAEVSPAVVSLTDGSSVAIDSSAGNVFDWPLGGSSHTLATPSNPKDGQLIVVRITYSGAFTPLFSSGYDFAGVSPAWTATSGHGDEAAFRYKSSASKWRYQGAMPGFSS